MWRRKINNAVVSFSACPTCLLKREWRNRAGCSGWWGDKQLFHWTRPRSFFPSVLHCSERKALFFAGIIWRWMSKNRQALVIFQDRRQSEEGIRKKKGKNKSVYYRESLWSWSWNVDISKRFVFSRALSVECDGGRVECSHAPHKSDFFTDNHAQCSGTERARTLHRPAS